MKIEIPSPSPSSQTPPAADDSRKWTVMVFMGVNTEEGNAPLVEAARGRSGSKWRKASPQAAGPVRTRN